MGSTETNQKQIRYGGHPMKKFRISRAYVTRLEWVVEAEDGDAALEMLDNDDQTPNDAADEEWLGPVFGLTGPDLEDDIEEIEST